MAKGRRGHIKINTFLFYIKRNYEKRRQDNELENTKDCITGLYQWNLTPKTPKSNV